MTDHPKVDDAPGIIWRAHGRGWEARWQCRTDLAAKGFKPKSTQLWAGIEPSAKDAAYISDSCRRLQDEMLLFGRGGLPAPVSPFDGTLRSLINCYQTDPDSPYQANRFHTRKWRDSLLKRLVAAYGTEELSEIKARVLKAWHKDWSSDGAMSATGSAFIGQLRALFSFGATMLEDPECDRLCSAMHKMRFPGTKARQVSITAAQANAIRAKAREQFGWASIALGQAFQFEGTMRQKDVIGEWVPLAEKGPATDIILGDLKWHRGIVWQEINNQLILKHITSKKQKEVVIDLKLAPMVLEELGLLLGYNGVITRDMLPASGAIIKNELTKLPWSDNEYRRKWRLVATAVGIPKTVKNMDSRSGAISEGIMAGASLEMVRHAATHSDISQTADYDRTGAESTATVMRLRVEKRKKQLGGPDDGA